MKIIIKCTPKELSDLVKTQDRIGECSHEEQRDQEEAFRNLDQRTAKLLKAFGTSSSSNSFV